MAVGYGYVIERGELNVLFEDSSCANIERQLEEKGSLKKLPDGYEYYWRDDLSLLVCIPNSVLNAVMAGIMPPPNVSKLDDWLKNNNIKTQEKTIGLCY